MMADLQYYAVLYVYDKDGSEKASMPCFNEEDVKRFASKYPKVLVKKPDLPPFWLAFKAKWRNEYNRKHPVRRSDDTPLEWLREPLQESDQAQDEEGRHYSVSSDQFYDGWGRHKTKF